MFTYTNGSDIIVKNGERKLIMKSLMDKLNYDDLLTICSAINRSHIREDYIKPHEIKGLDIYYVEYVLKRDDNPNSQIVLNKIIVGE